MQIMTSKDLDFSLVLDKVYNPHRCALYGGVGTIPDVLLYMVQITLVNVHVHQ